MTNILDELERLKIAADIAAENGRGLESLFLRADFENLGRSALPALIRVARAAEHYLNAQSMDDDSMKAFRMVRRAAVDLEEALQQLGTLGTADEGVREVGSTK